MVFLILFLPLFVLLIQYPIRWVDLSDRGSDGWNRSSWVQTIVQAKGNPLLWLAKEYLFCWFYIFLFMVGLALLLKEKVSPRPLKIFPGTDKNPVILIHGLLSNSGVLLVLNHRLNRANFKNVFLFSYRPASGTFENYVEQLSQLILQIHERLPDQKIHFVGHSLGGMVALSALQNPEITPFCEKLITLGTPFRGTKLAHLAVTKLGKCLRPGHPFLADFQNTPKGIHVISIRSDFDALILPGESSEFQGEGGESIRVDGIGHTGLCFGRKIADLIVERL